MTTRLLQFARSYTGRMLIGTLAIHAVLIALLFLGLMHVAGQEDKERFVGHARAQSFLLASLFANESDPSRIAQLADDLVLSGQVAHVTYVAPSGNMLSSAYNVEGDFWEDFFFGDHADHMYYIAAPIRTRAGAPNGKLRLGFDELPVEEHVKSYYRGILFVASGYLALALLFVGFFGHLLTKPIRQLRDAARRIADGLTEERLAVDTSVTEVAHLARDLESMRRELVSREHEITLREARQRAVLETAAEGIIIVCPEGQIMSFNQAAESIFGYATAEVLNQPFTRLLSPMSEQAIIAPSGEPAVCVGTELEGLRKGGEPFQLMLSVSEAVTAHSRCFTLLVQDVSERHAFESQLAHLATHDALTGLPNRTLYHDRLAQVLAHAARDNHIAALLFLDLDRFKGINDSLGHNVGDQLLQAVTERLRDCVRDEDTLARLGGDEFTLILPHLRHAQGAATVAQNILQVLEKSFFIGGQELFISGSIGIAFYPFDGADAGELVMNADTAMYAAKSQGGNNYQFYSGQMNAKASARLEMETQLRHAVDRGEMLLHYQPQVDIASRRIVGVEALVRWQHPERGLVPPGEFIPLAEDTGLIVPLGEWVLRTACIQGRAWQEQGLEISVAVNLAARQFAQPGLFETVRGILDETGFAPRLLELELTESTVMQPGKDTIAVLHQLKELGIRLSLDDFGTGYSSLSYLRRFPIDVLKIDRSFVQDISGEGDDGALASAIIAMAHNLGMQVIGEGVETPEQLAYLHTHRCETFQGYYFSKPLPSEAATALLKENLAHGTSTLPDFSLSFDLSFAPRAANG